MVECVGRLAVALAAINLMLAPAAAAQGSQPAPATEDIVYAGGVIRLVNKASAPDLREGEVRAWVRSAAQAVAGYFGRFPVPLVEVTVETAKGTLPRTGSARGQPTPRILIELNHRTTAADLARDSVLVHEMVHLAIPDHAARHVWLHEGIATYLEHVARARAGHISAAELWAEFMAEMPDGLPEPRDRGGLDNTPSPARRYWGGAIFSLVADIEIRKATGNRRGLQDGLRAINRSGGNLTHGWEVERTLALADGGTGTASAQRDVSHGGRAARASEPAGVMERARHPKGARSHRVQRRSTTGRGPPRHYRGPGAARPRSRPAARARGCRDGRVIPPSGIKIVWP